MQQLHIDFGAIIRNVAMEQFGAEVGQEVTAVYGHKADTEQVLVIEKHKVADSLYSYLVQGKGNPNYIGHAVSYKDGTVLIDNARIIGSNDPSFRVDSFEQARREVMQVL